MNEQEVCEAMTRNLLNRSMDSETIADVSGCFIEDMEEIKKGMNRRCSAKCRETNRESVPLEYQSLIADESGQVLCLPA